MYMLVTITIMVWCYTMISYCINYMCNSSWVSYAFYFIVLCCVVLCCVVLCCIMLCYTNCICI